MSSAPPTARKAGRTFVVRGMGVRVDMNEDIVIAVNTKWENGVPLVLSQADRRQHLYVVGKSGTGKTTLLSSLILQDIEAGRGVAVIDPHGDLAASLLEYIPSWRIPDVIYFDPSDADRPIGLNPLSRVEIRHRHLVASGVVSIFRSLYPDFWGPRLEYILYAAVAAILDCETESLLGVQRMLSDARYRAWVVKQVKDPMVRSFWVNEFEHYDKRFVAEAIAPIQNKVGQLLMAPAIRNILGQSQSAIDARSVMDRGRIFIANLSKGKIGPDKAHLMGALLVTQFQLAAMSRADVPEGSRRDFHLYVDEFQSFATDSFVSILSEARKYRLCLTLSHQYLDQLKPSIRDAVLGNVGSVVSFRVGYGDAKLLEPTFGRAFTDSQFTQLDNREVYAKLLSDGRDTEAVFARTLPPWGYRHGYGRSIRRTSRQRYASHKRNVQNKIRRWLK